MRTLKQMAVRYATEELGWDCAEVYGTQRDPKVPGCAAVWLRVGAADGTPVAKIGLVVNRQQGVLDEFDPEDLGEPGELTSGEPRFFF